MHEGGRGRVAAIRWARRALTGALALVSAAGAAAAQEDTGWIGGGETYLRFDRFSNNGDASLSPFANEGFQRYLDFSAHFERAVSPANGLEADLGGVLNESRYRADGEGLILERFGAEWAYGEGEIPLRLNAGDYFGNFSRRSLRRGLKGGQIELQPELGDGRAHSLIMLSGTTDQTWQDFDYDRERFMGGSWLVSDPAFGAAAVNVVRVDAEAEQGEAFDRGQTLASVALVPEFAVGGQRLTLDTEVSTLQGDAMVAGGARDESAQGYFAELSGADEGSTLTYSFLYENNDKDFEPAGGLVFSDREGMEARVAYRFEDGVALGGRTLRHVDDRSGPTPRRSGSVGLTLNGPLLPAMLSGATFYLDAFRSRTDTDGDGGDRRNGSLIFDLSVPVGDTWTVGASGLYGTDLDRDTGSKAVTRELGADLSRGFLLAGWRGTIRAGIVGRTISGGQEDADEAGFNLAASLHRGGHAFDFNLDRNVSDGRTVDGANALRSGVGFAYSYTRGNHTFGIDAVFNGRDQSPGNEVDARRIGVFYRLTFDVGRGAAAAPARSMPLPDETVLAREGLALDLAAIRPGLPTAGAVRGLAVEGLGSPHRQGSFAVYEVQMLRGIDERQRLVLESADGRIVRSALVVDPAGVRDGRGVGRLYAEMVDTFVDLYGAPDRVVEEGAFGTNAARDLAEGRLIRVAEWDRPDGSVLRLGIPRRLDGIMRVEAHHARSFPPLRQGLWSIEVIR